MDPRPEEIGARIKSARRAAGITQRALASALGVTVRTIQNYESGSTVPYKHLRNIEALIGKRPGWLLSGEDEDPLFTRLHELQKVMEGHRRELERQLTELRDTTERLVDSGRRALEP